jgi:hypothetical protein
LLVVIDPITAYLGVKKIDSFRTADVRAVLTPLKNLAEELGVAIIAVMHFNKKVDVTNALLRISDSMAFGALARHVYGIIDDAENDRKLFVRAKNNIAAKGSNQTLSFRFQEKEVGVDPHGKPVLAPYIEWGTEYVDVTATEAMQAAAEQKAPAARDDAKQFLNGLMQNGPASGVEEAAKANGISRRTLFRAKVELGIVAKKDGEHGAWRWHLPTKPERI